MNNSSALAEDQLTTQAEVPAPAERSGPIPFVFNNFARSLSVSISAQLRCAFEFQYKSIYRMPFAEVRRTFRDPACLAIFTVEPLETPFLLDLDPGFAKGIVELLLGGQPEGPSDADDSGLTEIEQLLFADIISMIQIELKTAVSRIGPYSFRFEHLETAPEMLRAFPGRDLVDLVNFEIHLNGQIWPMRFCQPVTIADEANAEPQGANSQPSPEPVANVNVGSILDTIGAVDVTFEARLNGLSLPLSDLASLKPGSVLHLRYRTSQSLTGAINGVGHFMGHIVNSNQRRGFIIDDEQAGR